jgi:hypothetical protein
MSCLRMIKNLLQRHLFQPPLLSGNSNTAAPAGVSKEAHLKASTCIKKLSNADQNDAALFDCNL